MLRLVYRKMIRNKWMMLCLLIGSVISVAMLSSIPMYTDSVMQRMLTKDLEAYQQKTSVFPGHFSVQAGLDRELDEKVRANGIKALDSKVNTMAKEYELPILIQYNINTIDYQNLQYEINDKYVKKLPSPVKVQSITDLDRHIRLVAGQACSDLFNDGVYEAIVTEGAYDKLGLGLDRVYDIKDIVSEKTNLKVKITGIFTLDDPTSLYWQQGLTPLNESIILNDKLFRRQFIDTGSKLLTVTEWNFALDYYKASLDQIDHVVGVYNKQLIWAESMGRQVKSLKMPVMSLLEQYKEREELLRTTLWVLQVPVLLMLAFYIFMVSQLIVESDKNEIAIFKSRGGGMLHIFKSYLIQGIILCIFAIIIGPPSGFLIIRILGASNGFLEFVQRSAIPATIGIKVYFYSLLALGMFLITMLIPALISARISIVQLKQRSARGTGAALWKKYFFDIVLLLISLYGLYTYGRQQRVLDITGAKASELTIDPILFMICTFFILGTGLIFIRVYPYIIKLLFLIGKRIWSPVLYASFVQVGRSGGKEQFLMLFIIFTLSNAIFSANSARTVNENIISRERYLQGADLRIMAEWPDNRQLMSLDLEMNEIAIAQSQGIIPVLYKEPPYLEFSDLNGAQQTTKVFMKTGGTADNGRTNAPNVTVMGIIPNEFGKVAWFRSDLMSSHWYHYLNFMTQNQDAVILSSSLKKALNVKEGDTINFRWLGQPKLKAVVYGFADYWPAFNPKIDPNSKKIPHLIVANLSYLHSLTTIEPYEVWIKKDENVTARDIYDQIRTNEIKIKSITSLTDRVNESKRDPILQGTNGSLNLGFVVTIAICIIGFLIYWILSIQGRILQFGILRAMGLSFKKVLGILLTEQILVSIVSMLIGVIIGGIASRLYVPLLGITQDSASRLLPFRIASRQEDYLKVYYIVSAMMAFSMAILGMIISRIKIDQAVKLGED